MSASTPRIPSSSCSSPQTTALPGGISHSYARAPIRRTATNGFLSSGGFFRTKRTSSKPFRTPSSTRRSRRGMGESYCHEDPTQSSPRFARYKTLALAITKRSPVTASRRNCHSSPFPPPPQPLPKTPFRGHVFLGFLYYLID